MNHEENKQEPGPPEEREPQSPEPVEEAHGSPEDPATLQQPTEETPEDTVESPEASPATAEPPAVAEEDVATLTEEDVATLTTELERVRRERDEFLESLRRLKAEFENSRKRQERERARLLESASERLVVELLPVLDNLDRALEAGGDIREGVRATREQLADALGKEGLLHVASDGQHFDPNVHEAVMSQPSEEHEEGTIIQTFQRGYLLNGKPIRPAKVVVARQD